MLDVLMPVAGAVLLVGLLWAEKTGRTWISLACKAPISVLFVLYAVLQPHPLPWYYHLVLIGLILGLVGDVCLGLPGDTSFKIGLVSFLAGHVLYVIAFVRLAPLEGLYAWPVLIILGVSLAAFLWLRPHLGEMMGPVIAYVVVITAMVIAAWAVFTAPAQTACAAWVILVGAVIFYLSDLFVSRDRFVKNEWLNRLLGLPLYFGGQFLLAYSVGLVR